MTDILRRSFFKRPADLVARELLGGTLCVRRRVAQPTERLIITETEAYMGPHDLACHAARGRTARTEVLYHEAGTMYVYLIYGMYTMLNIVTGDIGYPAAVLIRGAGNYDGPGKLTAALGISMEHNDRVLGRSSGIWIEESFRNVLAQEVYATPRVGVGYAGPWAKKKLRYVLKSPL